MRNTLRVGKIRKMKNRMVAGATQRNTNRLRLLSDFIDKPFLSTGIQNPKKAEAVKTASAGQGLSLIHILRGALVELIRVMEMMSSFQKDRKLNRIMVMIDGFAIGKMIRVIAEK